MEVSRNKNDVVREQVLETFIILLIRPFLLRLACVLEACTAQEIIVRESLYQVFQRD
jgi:hypothetical protein